MSTAQSPRWKATYPEHWVMETEEDSVLLYDPDDGIGTLEISCFCKDDGPATQDELRDLAADTLQAGARQMETQMGDKQGLLLFFTEDGVAWKEWYLAVGHCVFFVTYDCPEDLEGVEDDELAEIIASLRLED